MADEEDEGDDDEEESGEEEEYEVERIRKHRLCDDGSIEFQVRWKGYPDSDDDTWEPRENLAEVEALAVYEAAHMKELSPGAMRRERKKARSFLR